MDKALVIDATRRWISSMVIGLNLCPFARRVFESGQIRFVVSEAQKESTLVRQLIDELETLSVAPISEIETVLLIHPLIFVDFLKYNDFLGVADAILERLRLTGVIQIASFHPRYQFAGTDADAVENYTNRSPYPMLHLLREESISIVADTNDTLEIPKRNIQTLRNLGLERIREKMST